MSLCLDSCQALAAVRAELLSLKAAAKKTVRVCAGPGCLASGARAVARAIEASLEARGLSNEVGFSSKCTGCQGLCEKGPLVSIDPHGLVYFKVRPEDAEELVAESVAADRVVTRLCYHEKKGADLATSLDDIPFYRGQHRFVLARMGQVDPESLDDALAKGAYQGLARALTDLSPTEVIDAVRASGLRGRGGAGFPTARKWEAARAAASTPRYVVCNGDEGDPGAFKDRALMEGDPHAVIEGMLIGAYAIGASKGYIYVRDEYPLAVAHLELALQQARARGLVGDDILGTGFAFAIELAKGGGAFVCGESSAMMRAIAGQVGEPRQKYIHATTQGLFNQPTVLNNVETWAAVAAIFARGPLAFGALGTASSKGTKAFSLAGALVNTGLVELPMGTTLARIVYEIGGGIKDGRMLKAIQTGGPSGGCVPAALVDLGVDYEALAGAGSMMGSGGMIVMDDRTCMVEVARYFVAFLADESCGKCTPCREGLRQLGAIYERLVRGEGVPEDLSRIEKLAAAMQLASLCELGKSATNPVLATLRYFREEYEAHILHGRCPAGRCRAITRYVIDESACDGCHACVARCPTRAITGSVKKTHAIDPELCVSCGECLTACTRGAISHESKRPQPAGVS